MTKIFSIICLVICFQLKAQNLVQNPSFETMSSCPNWENQVGLADYWYNFGNTPDYFSTCCVDQQFSVPVNFAGYQMPFHGNSFMGLITYYDSTNYKEFIGGQLSNSLLIGTRYYVSFNLALAFDPSEIFKTASNKIGVKFSTVAYSEINPVIINNNPMVYSDVLQTDTLNWKIVSGSFIADSMYNYIILGNFFDDSMLVTQSLGSNPWFGYSYYYIDAVCLSTDSLFCSDFLSTTYVENDIQFNVFPNPFQNELNIESSGMPYAIEIYNSLGQILYFESDITEQLFKINLGEISSGYILIRITSDKKTMTQKIFKS